MALRVVTGVLRGSRGQTNGLGNTYEIWSPVPTNVVIADITSLTHTYLAEVPGPDGRRRAVPVVVAEQPRGSGHLVLTTARNEFEANQLDQLPTLTPPHTVRTRVRRDIATLSATERSEFVAAVLELRRRYPEVNGRVDPVSWWFKQDEIHAATHVHEEPGFMPWHRAITNRFEALLQEVNPGLALPYWDWTTDPRAYGALTAEFLGAAAGELGAPFTDLYDPTANPHRDTFGVPRQVAAAMPPRQVRRLLPPSGRGPREVRIEDLDWPSSPAGKPPPAGTDVTIHADQDVVGPGFDGPPGEQFERLWRSLTPQHGLAHQYIGGTLADPHVSFRDPMVFLLHSNLDRLWAGWQLRQRDFAFRQEASFRQDPERVYGGLANGEILFPEPNSSIDFQRERARRELNNPMAPWNGTGNVFPWSVRPEPQSPKHPDLVRPPLYDRYVWDDLCCAWATLLLGRRLPDNDIIRATVETDAAPPDRVGFVLRSGPAVSWWKGLRIPTDGGLTVEITTENIRNRAETAVSRAALAGSEIVFSKAVRVGFFFIQHWMMYRLGDLGWLPPGSRVTFSWDDD